MANVTNTEVDQAFYDAHRDAAGKLDAALVDHVTGKPRSLTQSPADKEFVQEWIKIKKHLRELKNCAPPTGGTRSVERQLRAPLFRKTQTHHRSNSASGTMASGRVASLLSLDPLSSPQIVMPTP